MAAWCTTNRNSCWLQSALHHHSSSLHLFRAAIDEDAMEAELLAVWNRHKSTLGRRACLSGGGAGGCMIYVPIAMGDEVVAIVRRHFATALEKITPEVEARAAAPPAVSRLRPGESMKDLRRGFVPNDAPLERIQSRVEGVSNVRPPPAAISARRPVRNSAQASISCRRLSSASPRRSARSSFVMFNAAMLGCASDL
jgi:hypothetical protein